jgi:hypothetical protein
VKDFNDLSGPWTGLSIQHGIRLTEAIRLTIQSGQIWGVGNDIDGEFELAGSYHPRSQRVLLTRRYTYTTEPSQEGVGTPYDYDGVWDGQMVSGNWQQRNLVENSGPFEMWPDREEDRKELAINFEELQLTK